MKASCAEVRQNLVFICFDESSGNTSYQTVVDHLGECEECRDALVRIIAEIDREIGNPLSERGADPADIFKLTNQRQFLLAKGLQAWNACAVERPDRAAPVWECVPSAECSFFTPLHHDRDKGYPLFVWLHSPGESGERQLLTIMPSVSMRNYVAAAPRGIRAPDSNGSTITWAQTPDTIELAACRVFEAIEASRFRFHVASERVFLAGFDAGGTMAFRIAMQNPERFAGVLSACGVFPSGLHPLAQYHGVRRLPVFLAVGRDSEVYSPSDACRDLQLFHSAGIDVALRQYPGGHELSTQMLGDMDQWISEVISSLTKSSESRTDHW